MADSPIIVTKLPQLTAHRGNLLSGSPGQGTPVHAASFVQERRIILEAELFANEPLLRLILVHELFHFIWPRLGNSVRREFNSLLEAERQHRVRGELGESSSVRKGSLSWAPRAWKTYVCESFCDTAAWLYAGVPKHETFALSLRWRNRRAVWFEKSFERYWELRCS